MFRHRLTSFASPAFALMMIVGVSLAAPAQDRPSPAALIAAQRDALVRLAYMDGVWRGPAWTILPSGEKHNITQTERIGPFLDGSVKLIEGRGYDPDGKVTFNAFGTISFNPATKVYTLHSHAMGNVGDFVLTPAADGFVWEIPAGPTIIRYTAVIKDGAWREVGDRIVPGKDLVRFFEMNLKRVGDTDWPAAGAVSPKENCCLKGPHRECCGYCGTGNGRVWVPRRGRFRFSRLPRNALPPQKPEPRIRSEHFIMLQFAASRSAEPSGLASGSATIRSSHSTSAMVFSTSMLFESLVPFSRI